MLTVIIQCEYTPGDNWMAFASWYSMRKNLPEAEVVVACKRGVAKKQYFCWPRRGNINFFMYSDSYTWNRDKIITIHPRVMALNPYDPSLEGPMNVKSNLRATFADYSEGCGSFVVSQWINRDVGPFQEAVKRFSTPEMSVNETKLLTLWQQSYGLYSTLEGG